MGLESTELSQAIAAIRDGLVRAQLDGIGSPVPLQIREIVLELDVELRHSASAGGGVKAYVLNAEAKGERSDARTHRLTVKLGATAPGGGDLIVATERSRFTPLPDDTADS